jgi:hypothetical protein
MGNKGLDEKTVERHPSYGMAVLNHTSSNGTYLFGSIAKHNSYISLKIAPGEHARHLANDWYRASELPIIEISMPETHLARLLFNPGRGDGVPVTITAINGKSVEPCPAPESVVSKFDGDLKETTKELVRDLRGQIQSLEQALLPGEKSLNKTQLKELLAGIKRSFMTITDSIPFIEDSFKEEMEDQTNKFVAELEAVGHRMIENIGLRAIGEAQNASKALPTFAAPQLTEGKDKK